MTKRYAFSLFFLIALILGLSLYFRGNLVFSQEEGSAQVVSEGQLRSIIAVQRSNEDKLFNIAGVVAVGVGLTEDGRPAIHVYLNRGIPGASAAAIPTQVDSISVRILETDEIKALDGPPGNNHRLVYDTPVPMGVSTGNVNGIFAGTLGVRVFRIGQSSVVGYITNNHVAAASGSNLCPAQLNPARTPAFGLDQCQPGRLDSPGNVCVVPSIGDLVQVAPIFMGGSFENTVDAAFVASTRSLADKFILDIGNPSSSVQNPAVNLSVRKSGRTTGLTTGTIQTVNTTVNVNYGSGCGTAKFVGQIIIGPGGFSAPGDSGSLILGGTDSSGSRRPVGLLFAGSSTITVANRISDVLGALHSQIDTN